MAPKSVRIMELEVIWCHTKSLQGVQISAIKDVIHDEFITSAKHNYVRIPAAAFVNNLDAKW